MINVILDPLPVSFRGYPINTDFRVGIQISQCLEDAHLSEGERMGIAANLLFGYDGMTDIPEPEVIAEGVQWFLSGWYTDRAPEERKKKSIPICDFDVDQWRLYSAFLAQYRIDLSTAKMHYWAFMGLLSTLNECAFTRVLDLRTQKPWRGMTPEQREAFKRQKHQYALVIEDEETEEEREERERQVEAFLANAKINRVKG